MTTSDTFSGYQPPPASGHRVLRRSRNNRVAAGVAGGLGEYFGLDPVLFRVLFATSAFFGGAGILAYLLAWAAIPDEGTQHAPIDGWVAALRRRHFPVWLVVVCGGLFLWAVAFSWWAPGPWFPVVALVVLLVVFFSRRELQHPFPPPPAAPPAPDAMTSPGTPAATSVADVDADAATVSLAKDAPTASAAPTMPTAPQPTDPVWVRDARAWFDEARTAARERRRRSLPIRIAVLATLLLALTTLAIIDAATGIQFQWYFWTTLLIVVAGMLVALVSRRWSWSLVPLLVPAMIGAIAFAGSHTSLHDGVGQREWKPTSTPAAEYKLSMGQGILDLRRLPTLGGPRTVHVTMGAGQVQIIAPKSLNLTVLANVHIGDVSVDGNSLHRHHHGGIGVSRTIDPPAGATGAALTVDVHLADGQVEVLHK